MSCSDSVLGVFSGKVVCLCVCVCFLSDAFVDCVKQILFSYLLKLHIFRERKAVCERERACR